MRVDLVQIGNSRGIRLPKAVIEQAQLTDELELEVAPGTITIHAISAVREGWEQAAQSCRDNSDDCLDDWDVTAADFEGTW